jgi:hypothetical protein
LAAICREIEEALLAVTYLYTSGAIEEDEFVELLLKIEEEQATPAGFVITASNTYDNWTVIILRLKGVRQACAAFEFQPETGKFRHAGTPCRESDRLLIAA